MKKTLSFEKDLKFQTMIGEVTTISFEEDLKFIDKSNIEGSFYISGKYKMTEASTLLEDFAFSVPIEIAMLENYDLETTQISVLNFNYEIVDDDTLRSKIDILVEGREEVVLEEEQLTREEEPIIIEEKQEVKEEKQEVKEEKQEIKKEINQSPENIKEEVEKELIREATIVKEECIERECDGEETSEELPIKKEEHQKKEEHPEKEEQPPIIKKESQEVKEQSIINQQITEETNNQIINNSIVNQSIEKPKRDDEPPKEKENQQSSIKVNSLFSNLGDNSDTFTTYSVYIMREGDSLEKVMDKYKVKREDLEVYNDLSTIELNSKVVIPTSNDE